MVLLKKNFIFNITVLEGCKVAMNRVIQYWFDEIAAWLHFVHYV